VNAELPDTRTYVYRRQVGIVPWKVRVEELSPIREAEMAMPE